MLRGEIARQGPLPEVREEQPVHADEIMENPASCRVLHWLALLIGKRGVMPLKGFAGPRLQGRIHQHADCHHQQLPTAR
jgi:hypothetical protein